MGRIVMQIPKMPCAAPEYNNRTVTVADKGQRRFRFGFMCGKTDEMFLYITFPKIGGVRIRNLKAGFFSCDELYDITYEQESDTRLIMTAGNEKVVYDCENGWKFTIFANNGKTVEINNENLLFAYDLDDKYQSVYLILPYINKDIYGFGEKFNSFKQGNNKLQIWNLDCCDGLPLSSLSNNLGERTQSYKNVPIMYSGNDFAMFFNTYYPVDFDLGVLECDKIHIRVYKDQFDVYIFTGSAEENLRSYLNLTGKPFLPPKWAFNYWDGAGTNIWNKPDRTHALENVTDILDLYKENGIPIHAQYLEIKPDKAVFDELKKRNVHLLMWTNSQLPKRENTTYNYENVYVKKASDKEKTMSLNYVDFTDESSMDAICDKLSEQWDNGQQGMMIDYADSMPEDSLCKNGKTGNEMHNFYAYWYARRMNEAYTERMGKDFILFQRPGCAGTQHYTAQFGGDMRSTFLGLRRSLNAALSGASSGFSIWGSDLGGFFDNLDGDDDVELYSRWTQFSAFCPLMRNHGLHPHWPWTFGETALENFKFYDAIRISLIDFIYSSAVLGSKIGDTLIKSMAIAYGKSPEIISQYLFCNELMVAPIVNAGQTAADIEFYDNGWVDLYTGKTFNTGKYSVEAPVNRIPVFIKAGAMMPVRLDNETLLPTLDESKLCDTLVITLPCGESKKTVYFDSENSAGISLKISGNELFADLKELPARYKKVILYGQTEILNCNEAFIIDKENNRTIINRKSDSIKISLKG